MGKLKYGRHCKVLKIMGRDRGMGLERWPRIVGEALAECLGTGTSADCGYTLLGKYGLLGKWKGENWTEKTWSKLVMETLKEGAKAGWEKRNSKKGRSGGLHAKTQAIMPSKIHKRKESK